jgi:translation initiation factor IF-3
MAHQEFGIRLLERVKADLEPYGIVEQFPRMEGRQLVMVLGPKKTGIPVKKKAAAKPAGEKPAGEKPATEKAGAKAAEKAADVAAEAAVETAPEKSATSQ